MTDDQPARYWDVFPKAVKQSYHADGVTIPVSVVGDPKGDLVFQSADEGVARVKNGWLECGQQVGATMVFVSDAGSSGPVEAMRYIQVEVIDPNREVTVNVDWVHPGSGSGNENSGSDQNGSGSGNGNSGSDQNGSGDTQEGSGYQPGDNPADYGL